MKPYNHGVGHRQTMSPPAWGRGLKLCEHSRAMVCHLSPPAWGRGLKRHKAYPPLR